MDGEAVLSIACFFFRQSHTVRYNLFRVEAGQCVAVHVGIKHWHPVYFSVVRPIDSTKE